MGLLDNVEKSLEKVVRGAFATGSKAEVQPVEIANRLRRELDNSVYSLSEGRSVVPNVFDVMLSDPDFQRAKQWGEGLADELCDVLIKHVNSQRYSLPGPVQVSFKHDKHLRAGNFEIKSSTVRSPGQKPTSEAGATAGMAASSTQPARPNPRAAQPHKLQPVLEISGKRYAINASPIILGRSSEADILVDDTGVSRKHLQIDVSGDKAWATDLGSTNGSHVNGERLHGQIQIHDGSVITMGRTRINFRLVPGRS